MFLGQIGAQNLKNTSILNSHLIFLNSIVLEFFSLNCVRVEKHIYLLGFLVEGITANNIFSALDLPHYYYILYCDKVFLQPVLV